MEWRSVYAVGYGVYCCGVLLCWECIGFVPVRSKYSSARVTRVRLLIIHLPRHSECSNTFIPCCHWLRRLLREFCATLCTSASSLPLTGIVGGQTTSNCTGACPQGHFCPTGTITPVPCDAGKYSVAGALNCTLCPKGRFGNRTLVATADCRCVSP